MEMTYSAEDEVFREKARAWLRANVPDHSRPPGAVEARDYDLAWQRKQYEGGWAGISWPAEFGGRALPLVQQMIWYEEAARAGAPSVGCLQIALNHAGPTLIAIGNAEQKAFHLPKIMKGEVLWCQGFSEPGQDPTSQVCEPAQSSMAIRSSSRARRCGPVSRIKRITRNCWCGPMPALRRNMPA